MYSDSWSVNTTKQEEKREETKPWISCSLSCPKWEINALVAQYPLRATSSLCTEDFRGLMMHVTSWYCNWDCVLPWHHAWEKVQLLKPGLRCWKKERNCKCVCLRIDIETGIWSTVHQAPGLNTNLLYTMQKAWERGKSDDYKLAV